jgi:asparagine synthase (glutamine-hydrolysing)
MEMYLEHGKLISRVAWEQMVGELKNELHAQKDTAILGKEWLAAFEHAVLQRAKRKCVGLLFSGGVDSSFIGYVLFKNKIPFTCYTAGFKDPGTKEPEDVIEAKKIAEYYGWKHRVCVLDLNELEPVVKRTVAMLGNVANPVSVGVGAVVVAAAEMAVADGVTVLFGGLGSEEIFAGYRRHDRAQEKGDLSDESWRGLAAMHERDLVRDSLIGGAMGISVPTPFMDERVIRIAMQLPDDVKIKDGHKKYILRELATEYGLAREFAFRPKRAAQYGSRMNKALARMAKRRVTSKTEYLLALQ